MPYLEAYPHSFTLRGKPVEEVPRERGCRWYVGCVKSRMEKRFAFELAAARVSYALPMSSKEVRHHGEWKQVKEVLFPGYIFVLVNVDDFFRARQNKRMWSWWTPDFGGQKFLREDLRKLILVAKHSNLISVKLEDFKPGRQVRVRKGHALAGLTGLVDRRQSDMVYITQPNGGLAWAAATSIRADLLELIP